MKKLNCKVKYVTTINEQIQNIAQKKDTLCRRMYNEVQQTTYSLKQGVSVANSIHHSKHIYNYLKALNLGLFLSDCI